MAKALFRLRINYDFPDFEVGVRAENRMHKAAGTAAMGEFIERRLPERFRNPSVQAQLRFEPRDEWYDDVKAERNASGRAHYWTGRAYRRALAATPRTTKRRMSAVITGLNEGYGRRRTLTKPDLLREVQRMGPNELGQIGQNYIDALNRALMDELRRGRIRRRF